jgi:H+/Cl- antiporter ClcA
MHSVASSVRKQQTTSLAALAIATVLVGILSGIAGMALGLLLHFVQHIAYGYGLHADSFHEGFLQGVTDASSLRRVLVLSICGVIAGAGWWSLYRFGSPLVSIRKAVSDNGPRMPFFTTLLHDLLQIVTVALGSPLGREVAPRELSAALATWLCDRIRLPLTATRILIACGAGAGLAAVYNVPLSGALFTMEGLLGTFSAAAMIPAIATSVIATVIAWIGLGNTKPYSVPNLAISNSLIMWSIFAGPFLGFAAYWFVRLTDIARTHSPKNWRLLPWCLVVLPGIGLLAIYFPQLLGNGRGLTQLSFDPGLTIRMSIAMLMLRLLVTTAAIRAGAVGGLLTPGLTIGALLGTIGGSLWGLAWPSVPITAFAIVGAVAFLATSMKMPITAIALGIEFTRVGHDFLVPILLAVGGSVSVGYLCRLYDSKHSTQTQAAGAEMKLT